VAERRVCSVLFCDLVGFTPLSEAQDPEAVRELLSAYFAVARTVIGRYGGVVEKFIGDAVMAVWGTPAATEGDAERAVRAGLDLVTAVAQLGEDVGVPGLAARAGVVTGEVAVTLGATHEGMVAGDAVNTAARVQAAAGPGQVLADGATQRLTEAGVGFADAGDHMLKGKAEPQHLWRATRVLAGMGGSQRIDGLEPPLTGRDAELRTVRELFHAAAGRRVPRLVVVSGPAGVGKSRLGWEFRNYTDGLAETIWWHQGRCLSYGEGVAFWALAEMVRQRLGIAEEDPAEVTGELLAAGLDEFVADPDERAYVGARLGRLLGVAVAGDSGGALSREELFAGWRVFFERLAEVHPVVLVVEDAQYADAGLLDFLGYLVDWTRDLPVFVLVLARPELGQARPGFGAGRNRSTLTLDPLDAASMDALVDALVPGMPAAARAKVAGQGQGIPLFAVETVRSLIDRDIVRPAGGVYELAGDIGKLAVPDSLHTLLAARLDALDPQVRRLVADAAVLGTTFPAEALIAVSGRDEPAVQAALAELVRREVLSVSADPLSPEKGSYGFAQNMLRQVAYDRLSRRDRKARHLAVATHLRAAVAAVTGADWALAVELAGKARDYHLQAGQARAGARAQAIAGRALREWGHHADAREQLTAAVEVLRADPDTDTVRALGDLATLEVFAGSPDADKLSAEALSLGQAVGVGDDLLSLLFATRGVYHARADQRPQAAAYQREAARLAGRAGDSRSLATALVNLSDHLGGTDPGAAAEAARAAAGHARRVGARRNLAFAIGNLVGALLMLGDWDAAEAELTQAADSDVLAGYEFLASDRAWLAALRGDTAAAQALLAGLEDLRASQDAQDKAAISLGEAFIAAARRQPQAALGHARTVLDQVGALGISADVLRWAWPLAARAAHDLRDTADVGELLALLDSRQPGHLPPMLRAERDLARARLAANDNGPDAGAAFPAAIAGLRQHSSPYHLGHGLLDHAEHLLRTADAAAAAAATGEACTIAHRLRCQPLLDRAGTTHPLPPAPRPRDDGGDHRPVHKPPSQDHNSMPRETPAPGNNADRRSPGKLGPHRPDQPAPPRRERHS
jgi:class 3 adenylate cyclase/predicted ATPase